MTDIQLIVAVCIPSVTALIGSAGVFVAILVNNSKLEMFDRHMNKRMDDLKGYIDLNTKMILDKIDSLDHRLTDLEGNKAK
jgi:hypothetical protein